MWLCFTRYAQSILRCTNAIVTCYCLWSINRNFWYVRVHTSHSHIFFIVFSFRQSGIYYVRMTEGVHTGFRWALCYIQSTSWVTEHQHGRVKHRDAMKLAFHVAWFLCIIMHRAYPWIGFGRVWVWFGPRIWNSLIRNLTRAPSRLTDSVPTQTALDSTYWICIFCVRMSWDTSWLHIRINSCADPNRYWQSGMMVQKLR